MEKKLLNKIQEAKTLINKDFGIISANGLWFLNKEWNLPKKPDFKIGFAFDNPEQVTNCPFFAEICLSEEGPHLYYGFVFGNSEIEEFSKEKLEEWTKKFPESKLFESIFAYGNSAKKQ